MNDSQPLPDQPSLSTAQAEQLDRLADAFERRWKGGDRATIEEYLAQIGPASRAALLGELVALEIEFRRAAGELVAVDEYRRRFPDDPAAVDAAFDARTTPGTSIIVSGDDTGGRPTVDFQPLAMPKSFDRYEVRRVLGRGGFGMVYLGHDTRLDRPVALKVPRQAAFSPDRVDAFIREARMAAQLTHPGLVAVYDVQPHGDGLYIVQQYVDGHDLAHCPRPLSHEDIVRMTIEIADAIGFAHQRNLVHRDLKPANVLIDQEGRAHVADFGLALDEGLERRREGEIAGTPAYMSPEQVRGESHRLDGRTDLWSLGVILYELLTGRRPFAGKNRDELFDEIEHRDPKPPRMINREVPGELERICLKCLAKPRTLRYSSAAELLDDLRHWQKEGGGEKGKRRGGDEGGHGDAATRGQEGQPPLAKIVPKGLRSFDAHDADFFLELLPGPHDRDGLPPGVRFWKTQIEQTDAELTFSVGLVYGPSGCGKSSLVRAGLLPRLGGHVLPVYVEATAADTEVRLLKGLRKLCPDLPADASLSEIVAQLRGAGGSRGRKVLLVLDQFEQWLHAHDAQADHQLVRALRQCDGAAVQCLLMVRDDFWMSITRFMQALETPLVEGRNSAAVDLFDMAHARKVLVAFGHAYGRVRGAGFQPAIAPPVPPHTRREGIGPDLWQVGNLPHDEEAFLDQAVAGLAQDGRVISVRLALFAEMMKGRPWTPASLDEAGGAEGVGVTFLENTFSANTAPPTHRLHQGGAREVLKALLPASGTDIKGQLKSRDELLAASGYEHRPADFESLLVILDGELRLITPTDVDEGDGLAATGDGNESSIQNPKSKIQNHFQLTHDYLVPSLRDWLTRKQRETRRGRAELRLAERAAAYDAKADPRFLPNGWEWPNILMFTKRGKWTPPERRVMRAAGRRHLTRGGALVALVATLAGGVISGRLRMIERQEAASAQSYVQALLNADTARVAELLPRLDEHRRHAEAELAPVAADDTRSAKARLHASLALLARDPKQVDYLRGRLLSAAPDELLLIREQLQAHARELTGELWQRARDNAAPDGERFRAACALAGFDPGGDGWEKIATHTAEQLVAQSVQDLGQWMTALRPARAALIGPLESIFRDELREPSAREIAASVLADYAGDDPARLAELLAVAEPKQFEIVLGPLAGEKNRAGAVKLFERELATSAGPLPRDWKDPPLDASWGKPPPVIGAQLAAAAGMLDERWALCQTLPLESFDAVAAALGKAGYRPTKFRPYDVDGRAQVAACWTRDGGAWRAVYAKSAEEARQTDESVRSQGLVPLDVTGHFDSAADGAGDQHAGARYAVLWGPPEPDVKQYLLVIDDTGNEWLERWKSLEGQTPGVVTSNEQRETAGQAYYGVWRLPKGNTRWLVDAFQTTYEAQLAGRDSQSDVRVLRAPPPPTSAEELHRRLADFETAVEKAPGDVDALYNRGYMRYFLGDDEDAVADLTALLAKPDQGQYRFASLMYRSLAEARRGRREAAEADLEELTRLTEGNVSFQGWPRKLATAVAAELGDGAAVLADIDERLRPDKEDDKDALVWSARFYALVAGALARERPDDALRLKAKAFEWLKRAGGFGLSAADIEGDDFFGPLAGHPDYVELMRAAHAERRYTAVWQEPRSYESRSPNGLSSAEQVHEGLALAADGWRAVAVSVVQPADEAPLVAATVWRRPYPDSDAPRKRTLVERQAHAAAALARLGQAGQVWPLLVHSPDPGLRTAVLHELAPLGVDPNVIINRLFTEREGAGADSDEPAPDAAEAPPAGLTIEKVLFDPETSLRRALILALGEYDKEHLTPSARESLVPKLTAVYRDDVDAGVHGACDWLLRRWGHSEALDAIDREPASGQSPPVRRWHVNGEGQTLALVGGPVEFLMGSPLDAEGRSAEETPHLRRIGRSFAIATKEVSLSQFKRFRKSAQVAEHGPAAAVTRVKWYDAAAYCNWLSEREGIPKEQWCYAPNDKGEYAAGMKPAKDHLELHGYRLPTEAEWEFACRAGAASAYAFGDDAWLRYYAWYDLSASLEKTPLAELASRARTDRGLLRILESVLHGGSSAMAIGRLKPNELGLFDLHGNAWEWTDSPFGPYPQRGENAVEDLATPGVLTDQQGRVLRGGAFNYIASNVRSADRSSNAPANGSHGSGFRVARTYP